MAAPLRAARTVARSPRPQCWHCPPAGLSRLSYRPAHLLKEPGLLGLRRHGQPDEIVVAQPGVGEQPGRVRVEVHEGACSSVEDAGPLLDEPADRAQRLEEVVDALQVGGRRVAHEGTVCRDERELVVPGLWLRSRPGAGRPGGLRRGRNRLPAPGSALETACTAAM